jgi:uncharacterized membrane protein YuzA (DUF378 family)
MYIINKMLPTLPYMRYLHILIQLLIIVGALNYLTISLKDFDIVDKLSMKNTMAKRTIEIAIGASGLYAAYLLLPTLMNMVR